MAVAKDWSSIEDIDKSMVFDLLGKLKNKIGEI
jgi:hypothetical protein